MNRAEAEYKMRILDFSCKALTYDGNPAKVFDWCGELEKHLSRNECETIPNDAIKRMLLNCIKIDENEILNRDANLKEEVIKLFLENFSTLVLHPNHYGKTDLLELRIELQPGAVTKRSKVRPLNPDQRANLKEQLDE